MITWNNFEQMMPEEYDKLLRRVLRDKEEMEGKVWQDLYCQGHLEVVETSSDFDEAGRWTCPVDIIFQFGNKYYHIWFNKGLTEYQENEWEAQAAEEVEPVEEVRQVWKIV